MSDEAWMEENKSFVKALQELKNLRPQLYSAAEYCEKSYQCCKHKQMVIDNLKDYAVRAFVNALDHLGTASYKLTDILKQQTLDVSMMELKVTCLDQRFLTCQTYIDQEGLRQQQLLPTIPRLHKHYTLPAPALSSVDKVQWSPLQHIQTKPHLFLSVMRLESVPEEHLVRLMHRADAEVRTKKKTSAARPLALRAGPASSVAMRTLGIIRREALDGYKPMTPCRLSGKTTRAATRSKTAISAFFVKHKTRKLKTRAKKEDN